MKLLDRYLFSTFASALLLVIVMFMSLFLAVDLSSKFARILALRNIETGPFFLKYYMARIPLFLHLVLPAVTLFASMFTLIRFQKTNELLPMVTSGVSLRRLSLVFIAGAIACAGAMGALDEWVLPNLMDSIGETDDVLISDKTAKQVIASDDEGTHIYMNEYDRRNKVMTGVTITRLRKDRTKEMQIIAKSTAWNNDLRIWLCQDGTIEPYDERGDPVVEIVPGRPPKRVKNPIPPGGSQVPTRITPEDMRRKFSLSGRFYKMSELSDLMDKLPHVPMFQMQFHSKFSMPLGSLVLLFLGLPLVATTQSKSFFRGVGLCLVLTIAYYATHFLFFQAGNRGEWLSPVVASWTPTALFGLFGVGAFWRMKS